MGLIRDVGQIITELVAGVFSRNTNVNFYFYVPAGINSKKSWAAIDAVYLGKNEWLLHQYNLNYCCF